MITGMPRKAVTELEKLDRQHAAAVEARRRIDQDERDAFDAVRPAEHQVEQLHGRRMRGDRVDKEITAATAKLGEARTAAAREWPLERKAADGLVRETNHAKRRHMRDNADELLKHLDEHAQLYVAELTELLPRIREIGQELGTLHQASPRSCTNSSPATNSGSSPPTPSSSSRPPATSNAPVSGRRITTQSG
jgi:hypothetical protein